MMARVYLVSLPVIGKTAALKRLMPDPLLAALMGEDQIRERFIREAVTMAGLRHPHIVDVTAFDDVDGIPCYLMEYHCHDLGTLIGETYRTEHPSRVIRIDRAVELILDVLSGLARLHHEGIVHRDIKPYNILLTDEGRAKVGDLGLSTLRGETIGHPANLKVGSPFYAAPEQERRPDQADERADLYAVGVMLYRMVTGTLPQAPMTPPSRFNPDLDARWDHFMENALARDPAERFPTALCMGNRLEALLGAWREEQAARCRLPGEAKPAGGLQGPETPAAARSIRSRPVKVAPRKAPEQFGIDSLWRPTAPVRSRLTAGGDGTVTDAATALVWQRSGTPYPVRWREALAYVAELNRSRFAGRSRWRLPTVDELLSILSPTRHGEDFCAESVFDTGQKWVWSADRRSFTAAYYVSFEMGFVAWHDMSGYFHAKGVCTDRT